MNDITFLLNSITLSVNQKSIFKTNCPNKNTFLCRGEGRYGKLLDKKFNTEKIRRQIYE